MNYNSNIVKKPWGYEYLVYKNNIVSLWYLHIEPENSTSLHCHPNKTTGLIILNGQAKVNFFNNQTILNATNKIMIRKGLFHSTESNNECVSLFEIETPIDKHDLVRYKDNYGREGKPYEDESFETPKLNNSLWIENKTKTYSFEGCILEAKEITNIDDFLEIEDSLNIIFLKGGLLTNYNQNVAGPGDIVVANVVKKLAKQFRKISPDTFVIVVKKE